jgi:hypothetical protein
VGNGIWRDYLRNPREFDGWLKANAVVGSIFAIGMIMMALAGLNSAERYDRPNEVASSAAATASR